jgi:transporter family protein
LGVSELAPSASWVCYVPALQPGDVSKVAPVDRLSLLLIAVFAVMFLHECSTMQEWVGILLVGAGVLILDSSDERPRVRRYTTALRPTALA